MSYKEKQTKSDDFVKTKIIWHYSYTNVIWLDSLCHKPVHLWKHRHKTGGNIIRTM